MAVVETDIWCLSLVPGEIPRYLSFSSSSQGAALTFKKFRATVLGSWVVVVGWGGVFTSIQEC